MKIDSYNRIVSDGIVAHKMYFLVVYRYRWYR